MKKNRHSIILFLLAAFICISTVGTATADQSVIYPNSNVNLTVANDNGARFDNYGNDTYNFFGPKQTAGQGQNEPHFTTNTSDPYGGVYSIENISGTFHISNTGGRGWWDNVILMIAVNGTIPDNFAINIVSSGYRWTPVPDGTQPSYSNLTYYPVALNETFYKSDLIYGPQNWKPVSGPNIYDYPIFAGQNMEDTNTNFNIMFIDLYAGVLTESKLDANGGIIDDGLLKVQYMISNLNLGQLVAFNIYGYSNSSAQGTGIRWTNRLAAGTLSGYTVKYTPVTPIADFTANNTTGSDSLTVKFTDTSANYPLSWLWDFGDGTTSTEQNPTHTYTKPGVYTVKLTASNPAGNDTITKTDLITVLKSNVYVDITTSNSNPKVGDKITYTFKLGNKGPGIAKDVVFTYVIPEGLEYAGANVDQGTLSYNETTRTLTWTLGDVAVGDPYLWLNLNILSAVNFNVNPTVTVSGNDIGSEGNIGSLLVSVPSTVNAATVPMQATGVPVAGLAMALLMVGSGLALGRRK